MVYLIRNRNKFYKKSLVDVWGRVFLYSNFLREPFEKHEFLRYMAKVFFTKKEKKYFLKRLFVYQIHNYFNFELPKRLKSNYIEVRLMRNFYLILKKPQFTRYALKARKIYWKGGFEENYLLFLECRLFMLAYRSLFMSNLFKIRYVLSSNIFFVNGIAKGHSNYLVNVGDIVQLNSLYWDSFTLDILLRLHHNVIPVSYPNFLFTNYNYMMFMIWRKPLLKDLFFPSRVDVFRSLDFYNY